MLNGSAAGNWRVGWGVAVGVARVVDGEDAESLAIVESAMRVAGVPVAMGLGGIQSLSTDGMTIA